MYLHYAFIFLSFLLSFPFPFPNLYFSSFQLNSVFLLTSFPFAVFVVFLVLFILTSSCVLLFLPLYFLSFTPFPSHHLPVSLPFSSSSFPLSWFMHYINSSFAFSSSVESPFPLLTLHFLNLRLTFFYFLLPILHFLHPLIHFL